jgi:isochorismate pyruvate lyase
MEPARHGPPLRRFVDPAIAPLASDLDGVRREIDRIDEQIVRLLAERLRWVRDATRFKADGQQVQAPARQAQVLAQAAERARAHDPGCAGFDTVVEATFRAMMAACIAQQDRYLHDTEPLR